MGIFLIFFHHTPDAVPENAVTYTYGGRTTRKVDFATAYDAASGCYYLCFTDLADYLNLAETGTAADRRFLFADADGTDAAGNGSEEYIRFPEGASTAIVNGQEVHLDGPTKLIGEDVWVTTDVVSAIMQNVSLQIDGSTIAVARVADPETETDENGKAVTDAITYLKASFRLKSASPMETISEGQANVPVSPAVDSETGETQTVPEFVPHLRMT